VNSSPAFKWLVLLLLLPITLGVKLAVRPSAELGELSDKQIQLRVAEFLFRQHFTVVSSEKIEEGRPIIQASAGACRVVVAKSPAIGSDRDVIRRLATATDRVFAVYRGKVYVDQPTWLTVSDYLWARLQRELGLNAQAAPVLAVIAGLNCGAEQLSWNELG
jgi:hypothetical protein